MPRWRKIIAAVCLLAGGLFLFRGLPSFSEPAIPPSSPGLAANASGEAKYVTTDIEKVRVGDMILAMDPETGELQPRRVIDAFHRTVHQLRVLTIRDPNGQDLPPIRTTHEHPFWVTGIEEFIPAGELEAGDELLGPDGEITTVAASHIEYYPKGVSVYNFEVEGAHTYFVIAGEADALHGSPVLVHNAKLGTCGAYGTGHAPRRKNGQFRTKPGPRAKNYLKRPYIRKSVLNKVLERAMKLGKGTLRDRYTNEKIGDGPYHVGHAKYKEFRRMRQEAQQKGWSQKRFNDYMNDPDLYVIQTPKNNMSGAFEAL